MIRVDTRGTQIRGRFATIRSASQHFVLASHEFRGGSAKIRGGFAQIRAKDTPDSR